jgi:hypothetical protein
MLGRRGGAGFRYMLRGRGDEAAHLSSTLMQGSRRPLAAIRRSWRARRGLGAGGLTNPSRLGPPTSNKLSGGVGHRLRLDSNRQGWGGGSSPPRLRSEEAGDRKSPATSEATEDMEPLRDRCPQGREPAPSEGGEASRPGAAAAARGGRTAAGGGVGTAKTTGGGGRRPRWQHHPAPERLRGARSLDGGPAELANMPSVAAAEAAAAVLVREDKEPLSQMPPLILNVDEMREGDVIVQLNGEVNNTVEDVAKGAVHSPGRLHNPAKLRHVGSHPVGVKMGCAARHPDSRQRVRRRPPVDEGAVSGSPGDPHLQLRKGGQAGPLSVEPDTKKLGGGHHEDISDISRANTKIIKQEGIALFLGEVGAGRPQVDEDRVSLKVGDVVERRGGGCRRPHRRRRTPSRGSESISVTDAGWKSD